MFFRILHFTIAKKRNILHKSSMRHEPIYDAHDNFCVDIKMNRQSFLTIINELIRYASKRNAILINSSLSCSVPASFSSYLFIHIYYFYFFLFYRQVKRSWFIKNKNRCFFCGFFFVLNLHVEWKIIRKRSINRGREIDLLFNQLER